MKTTRKAFLTSTLLFLACSRLFAAPHLDTDALLNGLGGSGWNKKNNTATEYKSAGSNYRTYRPMVSPTPEGGLLVSTKIDHIRGGFGPIGAGDDTCILELVFGADGKLLTEQAKVEITTGNKKLDTGILTSAVVNNKVDAGAKVFNKFADQVATWGESGGRKNFPLVVKHNANWVAASVTP